MPKEILPSPVLPVGQLSSFEIIRRERAKLNSAIRTGSQAAIAHYEVALEFLGNAECCLNRVNFDEMKRWMNSATCATMRGFEIDL